MLKKCGRRVCVLLCEIILHWFALHLQDTGLSQVKGKGQSYMWMTSFCFRRYCGSYDDIRQISLLVKSARNTEKNLSRKKMWGDFASKGLRAHSFHYHLRKRADPLRDPFHCRGMKAGTTTSTFLVSNLFHQAVP
jgi:hypothetical protein